MIDGVISGLVMGSSYSILAVCIVTLYRLVGVVNFSQAAVGALGAYTVYALTAADVPFWGAVGIGAVLAALISGAAGWMFTRWFATSSVLVKSSLALVLFVVLLSLGYRLFGDAPRVMPSLVPEVSAQLAGVRVSLSTGVAVLLAVLCAFVVTWVLGKTRIGLRFQAMSERPQTLQLLGVNTRKLAYLIWAAAGVFSVFAILFVAPTRNPTFDSLAFLVIPALAAAAVARFSNVWVAGLAGLLFGGLEGALSRSEIFLQFRGVVPFIVMIVCVIWARRKDQWDAR